MTTLELLSLPVLQRTASRTTVSLENVEMWESDSEEAESSGRFDRIDGMLVNPRKTFDFSELRRMKKTVGECLFTHIPVYKEENKNEQKRDGEAHTSSVKAHAPIIRSRRQNNISQAWLPKQQQSSPNTVNNPPTQNNNITPNQSSISSGQTNQSGIRSDHISLSRKHERTLSKDKDFKSLNQTRSSSLSRTTDGTIEKEKVSHERSPTRAKSSVNNQIQVSSHTMFKQAPRKPPRRQLPKQPTNTNYVNQYRHQQYPIYTTQHSSGSDSSFSSQLNKTYVVHNNKTFPRGERAVDSLETLPKRTKSSDSDTNSNSSPEAVAFVMPNLTPHGIIPSVPRLLERKHVKFHGIVQMKEGDTNSYDFLRMSGDTARLYKKKYLPSMYAGEDLS